MSIYDKDVIWKLANNQLNNDLNTKDEKLLKKEFDKYFQLMHILGEEQLRNKWHFYLTDDVYDLIIDYLDMTGYNMNSEFDTTEHLEYLLQDGFIQGFYQLNKDLWIIDD